MGDRDIINNDDTWICHHKEKPETNKACWIIIYLSQLSLIAAILFRAVIDHDWWILFLILLFANNIEFNGFLALKGSDIPEWKEDKTNES